MAIFSFAFAVAVGALWEIFEFSMDSILGLNMQKSGLVDTMWDLIVDTIGAVISSIYGCFYEKKKDSVFFNRLVNSFIKSNSNLFNDTLQISNGDEINSWNKQWNILGRDYATSLAIDSFEDIYVLGSAYSVGNGNTPFLSKLSKSGDLLWQKFFITNNDNSSEMYYNIIKTDGDDNLFIAGFMVNYSETLLFRSIIFKYNSTGYLIWNKTIGKSNSTSSN